LSVVTGRKARPRCGGAGGTARGGHGRPAPPCRHAPGVGGPHAREVKFAEGVWAPNGHGSQPGGMGAEPRKYGVRSVFDTLVVHTVNDGCRRATATLTQSTSPGNQPQGRGPKEIGGSLLKRWGMWFNSTVHGAPYQPPWRPRPAFTRSRGQAAPWRCMAVVSSCCEAWPWVA